MAFWHGITQRKIYRVAGTYAVVAWLIAQVVTAIDEPLRLPEWFAAVVIVALMIGFPVTAVVCWAFERTPARESPEAAATESSPPRLKLHFEIALFALFGIGLAWLLFANLRDSGADSRAAASRSPAPTADSAEAPVVRAARARLPNSVAVLPFANLSPNPDDAYFAAGLHDEILNQLAKTGAMNVIARASVLPYPGSGKSIQQIADELNVETVMEGSIRHAGGRIRVTTQLIDAASGVHVWSETYDREFADVFAIESDIAMNVAAALEAELVAGRFSGRRTSSPEAYALYLEARNLYGGDGAGARIEELLRQAIELDPNFAAALGLLAERYAIGLADASSGDGIAPGEREARAALVRNYAEQAIQLDASTVDAHTALGVLDLTYWHWTAARQHFEAANELGGLRDWAADLYAYTGDLAAAVRMAQRLVDLSPNDWAAHRNLAQTLLRARRYDEAAASLRRSLDLAPQRAATHRLVAQVEALRGNRDAALRETRLAEQLLGAARTNLALAQLALLYGALDGRDDAVRLQREVLDSGTPEAIGTGNLAMVYLAVDDERRALESLREAAAKAARHELDRSFLNLMQLKTTPGLDPALERPEFAAVLSRIAGD